jgi:hypothetical protein
VAAPEPPQHQVIAVFDPHGTGSDFAYTVGLAPLHPELHVWARPPGGVDPGVDWVLSPTDCARILNRVADSLRSGTRDVGDTWDELYDNGEVRVTWVLAPPEPSPAYDTFQLADGTLVSSLHWSLHRPPPGVEDQPVSEFTEVFIAAEAAAIDAEHPGLVVPDPESGPSARFGPWTPVIDRARSVLRFGDDTTLELLAGSVNLAGTLRTSLGVVAAVARRGGRQRALDNALAAASDDARFLADSFVDPSDPAHDAVVAHLRQVFGAAYGALAVRDQLADDDEYLTMAGLVDAVCQPVRATERFWEASFELCRPQALRALRAARRDADRGFDASSPTWYADAVTCAHLGVGAPLDASVTASYAGVGQLSWAGHCAAASAAGVVSQVIAARLS